MYTIFKSGSDCDGMDARNYYLYIFYSKKVADYYADNENDFSDGIIHNVIKVEDLHRYDDLSNCEFIYSPIK